MKELYIRTVPALLHDERGEALPMAGLNGKALPYVVLTTNKPVARLCGHVLSDAQRSPAMQTLLPQNAALTRRGLALP
jgi:hypothetical protein